MIGVRALGRTCRARISSGEAPRARAADTKSISRTCRTLARTMRAYTGIETKLMAIRALSRPDPSTLTIAIARSKAGKASSTSMIRMMTLSSQPPV